MKEKDDFKAAKQGNEGFPGGTVVKNLPAKP